jgi:magnesium transporter
MYESFLYQPGKGVETDISVERIEEALKDEKSILWVDILHIDDADIDLLTNIFNLHSLTVEDCILPNARPKVENFKNYIFLIMYAIEPNQKLKEKIKTVELDACLGKNFLITAHSDFIAPFATTKDKIRKQSPVMMQGADFLLFSITDSVVDSYFPVIDAFDNNVDVMSDELFKEPTTETLATIYYLKNEIMLLRRTIGPQADVINLMLRGDSEFISPANLIYFRNIYDNLIRLNDIVGTSRDIVTSAIEAYVSVVSNRLNEIMKTLTVIATIMMPLTLIASIYGMNFKYMPELACRYSYPVVIALMIVMSVAMLYYFKRKKWL